MTTTRRRPTQGRPDARPLRLLIGAGATVALATFVVTFGVQPASSGGSGAESPAGQARSELSAFDTISSDTIYVVLTESGRQLTRSATAAEPRASTWRARARTRQSGG